MLFGKDTQYTDLKLMFVTKSNGNIKPQWLDAATSDVVVDCKCELPTTEEAHKYASAILDTLLHTVKGVVHETLDSTTVRVWSKELDSQGAQYVGAIGGVVLQDPATGKFYVELRTPTDVPIERYGKDFDTEAEAVEYISSDDFADYAINVFSKYSNIDEEIQVKKIAISEPLKNRINPSIN